MHLLGGATGGGGIAAKVAAGGAAAVLAAGGATYWAAGRHEVIRGKSPAVEAGGKALIGKPIRPGTKLPASVAIATLTVELPASQHKFKALHARVTCPAGMLGEGLAIPRTQDGKNAGKHLRMYQTSRADYKYWRRTGLGRRTTQIDYAAKELNAPVVISVGMLCKRH
jgi:hypothetical protein